MGWRSNDMGDVQQSAMPQIGREVTITSLLLLVDGTVAAPLLAFSIA